MIVLMPDLALPAQGRAYRFHAGLPLQKIFKKSPFLCYALVLLKDQLSGTGKMIACTATSSPEIPAIPCAD
jgi:hypothetical protein